ncbi:hypothetical protein M3N64_11790 [Sporolactobacillus sp. CPB3-1]|uniref:Uncharacterized protein n=1 Tax=Sporolactobacillus mangiferae TaxID=2940498 RepID=A0ABT0MEA4_9BACL|nr:hypothetical protein [Sporolactobacillus mangiferae]MCL1632599.1 hypothetical protein [Sporolactobacillus mangiferae]
MLKTDTSTYTTKRNHISARMEQITAKIERLSAEECLNWITQAMYRIILFLGVPYFLYVLISFIRMNH